MLLKDIVSQLETEGFEIEFRSRQDGGLIITKINGVSFKGSAGNTRARQLAGVSLSEAQISQRAYNVRTYIKGFKKPKEKFDEEVKAQVRRVQYLWRRHKVNGKITMRKAREHFKHEGKKGAMEYLYKMQRYGEGLAYEENVIWLSDYTRNVANGLHMNGEYKARNEYIELANYMLAIKDIFHEAWIHPIYNYLYEIRESGYNGAVAMGLLPTIYAIMK